MVGKFSPKNVDKSSARFPEEIYTIEVVNVKLDTTRVQGLPEITVQFKIVDARSYNNARVFEHLIFTERKLDEDEPKAQPWEIAVQRVADMGIDLDDVEANTLGQLRKAVASRLTQGMQCRAKLFKDDYDTIKARFFRTVV